MYKVIVERPRRGKSDDAKADRRRKDLDGPIHLGMRAGFGHRGLNENLNPLKRFLRAQIGRPWAKVHGEISAGIDRRNTVQLHIFAHLDDMIAVQVEWRDGELVDLKDCYRGYSRHPHGLRQELYVDPRTGLIRPNKSYRSWSAERRAEAKLDADRRARSFRRIDQDTELRLLDGEWFEVRVADVPPASGVEFVQGGVTHRRHHVRSVYDVVLRKKICARDGKRYAISKRQLSRREIDAYGLARPARASTPAGS